MKKLIQIVGPAFSNYSYARVNRSLALALVDVCADYEIKVVSNEKVAERNPTAADFAAYPALAKLHSNEIDPEGIVLYQNFPREQAGSYGIAAIEAPVKIAYIPWEETVFPAQWAEELNSHATIVAVTSNFVKKILQNSGVAIPIVIIGCAIDPEYFHLAKSSTAPLELKTQKKFKFLNIGSGVPRKGLDLLVRAYCEEFTAKDQTCLVIKTGSQGRNVVSKVLSELPNKDLPEVEVLTEDFSDGQMVRLIKSTDVGVYPTRAEGFGLPMAETLLFGKPLITTGYSALLDFCTNKNSWLIDYKLVDAVESQLSNLGAKWAEPDSVQLRQLMRRAYAGEYPQILAENAKQAAAQLNYVNMAKRVAYIIKLVASLSDGTLAKRLIVSPINTQSGIADYAGFLHKALAAKYPTTFVANSDISDLVSPDDRQVLRLWTTGEIAFDQVVAKIKTEKPQLVHIEYHSFFYKPDNLAKLIERISQHTKVVVTLHSSTESRYGDVRPLAASLSRAAKVLVHSSVELALLQQAGITNAQLFVHGVQGPDYFVGDQVRQQLSIEGSPIVATHGLLVETKGILQLIDAAAELKRKHPKLKLLLLSALSSNNAAATATRKQLIAKLKETKMDDSTILIDSYLSTEEVVALLSMADIGILAYDENGEAASGAIQKFFAAKVPLIVTDIKAFGELGETVTRIKDNKPATIAKALTALLEDSQSAGHQFEAREQFFAYHEWGVKQLELASTYSSIASS